MTTPTDDRGAGEPNDANQSDITAERWTVYDRLREGTDGAEMASLVITSTSLIAAKLLEVGIGKSIGGIEVDPASRRRVIAIESVRIMEDILDELGVLRAPEPAHPTPRALCALEGTGLTPNLLTTTR